MTGKQHWTAEQTAHPDAKNDRWALVYNPTPGGRDNGDGTRSFSMCFPALLLSDCIDDPESAARDAASKLNVYPELLEALQNAMGYLDTPIGRRKLGIDANSEWLTNARATIAKATENA